MDNMIILPRTYATVPLFAQIYYNINVAITLFGCFFSSVENDFYSFTLHENSRC